MCWAGSPPQNILRKTSYLNMTDEDFAQKLNVRRKATVFAVHETIDIVSMINFMESLRKYCYKIHLEIL